MVKKKKFRAYVLSNDDNYELIEERNIFSLELYEKYKDDGNYLVYFEFEDEVYFMSDKYDRLEFVYKYKENLLKEEIYMLINNYEVSNISEENLWNEILEYYNNQ